MRLISDYCCYCGERILNEKVRTKEHIVPKSKGGRNAMVNLTTCCKSCNSMRGNLDLDKFILRLEQLSKKAKMRRNIEKYSVMLLNAIELKEYQDKNYKKLIYSKII